MGRKGLIPANTASARKAAANKVLQILGDDEAEDVTALDVDETVRRLRGINSSDYTAESLQSYASRVRSSLDDFKRHCDDPLNFKVGRKSAHRPQRDRSANARIEVANSANLSVRSSPAVQVLQSPCGRTLLFKLLACPTISRRSKRSGLRISYWHTPCPTRASPYRPENCIQQMLGPNPLRRYQLSRLRAVAAPHSASNSIGRWAVIASTCIQTCSAPSRSNPPGRTRNGTRSGSSLN